MQRTLVAGSGLIAATLMLGACASVEEGIAETVAETHRATLTGAQVVGGGDPDGSAKAELTISDELNTVCYDINDRMGLAEVTSVTVHRGAPGTNGPVVLRMKQANEGGWKNCVERREWIEDRLENAPGAFYVQIATVEYPNGAIRGQLRK